MQTINNGESGLSVRNKLNANFTEIIGTPKLTITQVASRGGIKNGSSLTSDFIAFKSFYHVYDIQYGVFGVSGVVYALQEHYVGSTAQGVYKSLDGGITWIKMGDLVINQAAGVWYESIFVEPFQETLYLLKANNGYLNPANNSIVTYSNALAVIATKNIGNKTWLSSSHNIDASPNTSFTNRIVIFGEYGNDINTATLNLWRTVDKGITWTSVLSQTGNNGVNFSGEIRHFHCVARDPYINGNWWASAGDGSNQCKIWKSTDEGVNWTLIFSGSQRERTCSFVFTLDYIYYGMDSQTMDANATKIVRIKRSDMTREDIITVDSGYSVYALTRTIQPEGFLIWSCSEPNVSINSDKVSVQWYDFRTEKAYIVADISTKGIPNTEYKGFQGASRIQDTLAGTVLVKQVYSGAGYTKFFTSKFFRVNITY